MNWKKIRILLVSLLIIYFFISITDMFIELSGMTREVVKVAQEVSITFSISKQDSDLIKPEYLSRIKVGQHRHNSRRPDVSQLLFDEQYVLIITKLDSTGYLPLKNIELVKYRKFIQTDGVVYSTVIGRDVDFNYKTSPLKDIDSIAILCVSDTLKKFKRSDTTLSFSAAVKSLSIRSSKSDTADILIQHSETFGRTKPIWISFLLLKKKTDTYLFVLGSEYDSNFNYDIVLDSLIRH